MQCCHVRLLVASLILQVSLQDFHAYLEVRASKFSERVFSALDLDASGRLDFREFLVGIW
jgi:hypothetical protein